MVEKVKDDPQLKQKQDFINLLTAYSTTLDPAAFTEKQLGDLASSFKTPVNIPVGNWNNFDACSVLEPKPNIGWLFTMSDPWTILDKCEFNTSRGFTDHLLQGSKASRQYILRDLDAVIPKLLDTTPKFLSGNSLASEILTQGFTDLHLGHKDGSTYWGSKDNVELLKLLLQQPTPEKSFIRKELQENYFGRLSQEDSGMVILQDAINSNDTIAVKDILYKSAGLCAKNVFQVGYIAMPNNTVIPEVSKMLASGMNTTCLDLVSSEDLMAAYAGITTQTGSLKKRLKAGIYCFDRAAISSDTLLDVFEVAKKAPNASKMIDLLELASKRLTGPTPEDPELITEVELG